MPEVRTHQDVLAGTSPSWSRRARSAPPPIQRGPRGSIPSILRFPTPLADQSPGHELCRVHLQEMSRYFTPACWRFSNRPPIPAPLKRSTCPCSPALAWKWGATSSCASPRSRVGPGNYHGSRRVTSREWSAGSAASLSRDRHAVLWPSPGSCGRELHTRGRWSSCWKTLSA